MTNKEALKWFKESVDYYEKEYPLHFRYPHNQLIELYKTAIKALEEYDALHLLVEWAEECGFGYDNIPEEYEKYKEDISDMRYTEGLIYIAKKEAEND